MQEVSDLLNDFLNQQNDAGETAEANDQTVPEGLYILQITSARPEDASAQSPWPGRPMVRCRADAIDKETSQRAGSLFFDMSPQVIRTRTGRQDGPASLWANAVAALGMQNALRRDIIAALTRFPFESFVRRRLKVPQPDGTNKYISPANREEEHDLLAQGAQPKNFVSNLRPVR